MPTRDDHTTPNPTPHDLPEGAFGVTVPITEDEPEESA